MGSMDYSDSHLTIIGVSGSAVKIIPHISFRASFFKRRDKRFGIELESSLGTGSRSRVQDIDC